MKKKNNQQSIHVFNCIINDKIIIYLVLKTSYTRYNYSNKQNLVKMKKVTFTLKTKLTLLLQYCSSRLILLLNIYIYLKFWLVNHNFFV